MNFDFDYGADWRHLASWWSAATATWNWQTVWTGIGAVVNSFLGAVALWALKASRDAARAAQIQTRIVEETAERTRAELEAARTPQLSVFTSITGNYYELRVMNVGTIPVALQGTAIFINQGNGWENADTISNIHGGKFDKSLLKDPICKPSETKVLARVLEPGFGGQEILPAVFVISRLVSLDGSNEIYDLKFSYSDKTATVTSSRLEHVELPFQPEH